MCDSRNGELVVWLSRSKCSLENGIVNYESVGEEIVKILLF
jgi:hypothetical protein